MFSRHNWIPYLQLRVYLHAYAIDLLDVWFLC